MQNAEAEDALLALGGTLTWEWADNGVIEFAATTEGHYQVGRKRRGAVACYARFIDWQASPFEEGFADESPRTYRGRAAAKAACEQHYATGKWGG